MFEISAILEEQANLILEGSAYFDVIEENTGRWLRVFCEPGDLLIFPTGKLYRFTTTPKVGYSSYLALFDNQLQIQVALLTISNIHANFVRFK